MNSQKISELLESRHDTYLEWVEPWPASGPDGKDVEANITIRASVNDCINLRRWHFKLPGQPTLDERELLADFISVYWARVVTAPNQNKTNQ
jgi:hypothetical protein